MGWKLDEIRETCEPVVATSRVVTKFFDVAPGQSLGIHQKCVGLSGGETKIKLDLQMYLDAPLPHDAIVVKGRPDRNLVLNGGVAGDDATVAALMKAAQDDPTVEMIVDIDSRTIGCLAAGVEEQFPLDDFTRMRFLEGLDDIGLTLRHTDAITRYEGSRRSWLPSLA